MPKRKVLKSENVISDESSSNNKISKKRKVKLFEIPVDKECKTLAGKSVVYSEGDDIYDVMLNQTNLQYNNNKFYLIQLLKDKDKDNFYVWMRWARVGKIGQMSLVNFNNNLDGAKDCFYKKFYDKTKNQWPDRQNFVKIDGKYDLVQIDYSEKVAPLTTKNENEVKLEILQSKLEDKLQDLMRMVFDMKEMDLVLSEMKYDANKLPLGQLKASQIKAGYKALREIEGLLNEGQCSNQQLIRACNIYYTRIPHDFGMRIPPLIQSIMEIKRELELLEILGDMKIAMDLIHEPGNMNTHPIDRHYLNLKCDLTIVHQNDPIFQVLNEFLILTHGKTHKEYELELLDLFEVKKEQEWANFTDHGNRMLLWHGSRTTNYGGILHQGLRIAPPEAPMTGHMFGKGIYFSDMSSKSANYIYPTKKKNVGLLLLCEVSLGTCNELVKANSRASKLPKNCHSVKGLGMIAPDLSSWKTMDDGVVVPVGVPLDTGLAEKHKGYVLNYNEYIVYKQSQVKMRYLLRVRFNFR